MASAVDFIIEGVRLLIAVIDLFSRQNRFLSLPIFAVVVGGSDVLLCRRTAFALSGLELSCFDFVPRFDLGDEVCPGDAQSSEEESRLDCSHRIGLLYGDQPDCLILQIGLVLYVDLLDVLLDQCLGVLSWHLLLILLMRSDRRALLLS